MDRAIASDAMCRWFDSSRVYQVQSDPKAFCFRVGLLYFKAVFAAYMGVNG